MTEQNETRLRQHLARGYRYLHEHDLTQQASGNISARCGSHVLISPTGAAGPDIAPEAFVLVDAQGRVQGEGRPSSELLMHMAIYQAKPEAEAVVHTHANACVAMASCRMPIPGFHYLVGSFGGMDIPCTDYACFGSQALADTVVRALADRQACLLANHGAIAWGTSLDKALLFAHRIEILASQFLLARQAGEPVLLTPADFEEYWERAEAVSYG